MTTPKIFIMQKAHPQNKMQDASEPLKKINKKLKKNPACQRIYRQLWMKSMCMSSIRKRNRASLVNKEEASALKKSNTYMCSGHWVKGGVVWPQFQMLQCVSWKPNRAFENTNLMPMWSTMGVLWFGGVLLLQGQTNMPL